MERNPFKILSDLEKEYGCQVPNFTSPPSGTISLRTLHRICIEKIKIYLLLEKISLSCSPFSTNWIQEILSNLKRDFIDTYRICTEHNHRFRHFKALHYDRISRFILYHVIVNSQSINVKKWILDNEIRLFRLQFLNLSIYRQEEFLLKHRIIKECSRSKNYENGPNTYQVPWTYVLPLIAKKSVPLKKGLASINHLHFSIAASAFQSMNISNFLNNIKIGLSTVKLDPRINLLITELQILVERCIFKLENNNWSNLIGKKINSSNIDNLSACFPPCMERIYNRIENTHHLKYHARQQFIPFLKDIGLSLNDTTQYLNSHFMQIMSERELKAKRYDYYIRYHFGLEGSRIKSSTKKCFQIQKFSEGTFDCDGCPLTTVEKIQNVLSLPSYSNISTKDKKYLLSLIRNTSPSNICSKILNIKHPNIEFLESITHPVQYYSMSCVRHSVSSDIDSSSDDQLFS